MRPRGRLGQRVVGPGQGFGFRRGPLEARCQIEVGRVKGAGRRGHREETERTVLPREDAHSRLRTELDHGDATGSARRHCALVAQLHGASVAIAGANLRTLFNSGIGGAGVIP